MNAKEPDQLLFWQLPEACGMEPFDTKVAEAGRSKEFFDALKSSITELQRAYEDLLRDLQDLLFRAFDLTERSRLEARAKAILSYCVEARLKAVVNHIANSHMEETLWIEAIATTIIGKAPKSWTDDDRVRFEIGLAEMSRNIRHLEALLYEESKRINAGQKLEEVFRIGVADRNSMELGAVVVVEQHEQRRFMDAVVELSAQLSAMDLSPQIALAALASISKSLLGDYTGSDDAKRPSEVATHG